MKTHLVIRATFSHDERLTDDQIKTGILVGMRDAFVDEPLRVRGDIVIEKWIDDKRKRDRRAR